MPTGKCLGRDDRQDAETSSWLVATSTAHFRRAPAMSGYGTKRERGDAPVEAAVPIQTPTTSAPDAGALALPRRPGHGNRVKSIELVANLFRVDVNRMPPLTLYDVTITPPSASGAKAGPATSTQEAERQLPPRLCRCDL